MTGPLSASQFDCHLVVCTTGQMTRIVPAPCADCSCLQPTLSSYGVRGEVQGHIYGHIIDHVGYAGASGITNGMYANFSTTPSASAYGAGDVLVLLATTKQYYWSWCLPLVVQLLVRLLVQLLVLLLALVLLLVLVLLLAPPSKDTQAFAPKAAYRYATRQGAGLYYAAAYA